MSGEIRSGAPARAAPRAAARNTVLGLDLAGSPHRSTGWCVISTGRRARVGVAHADSEIEALADETQPALIIIDAPLSLPRGRRTIEDRTGPHLRECDRELLRRRIRFFPLTLGPMRMLTVRGMRLAGRLGRSGFRVVEGYPGAAQDLLGIPRKGRGVGELARGLGRLGVRTAGARSELSHDELDALTIAWVGREHLQGRSWVIGDPEEGLMVLPRPRRPGLFSAGDRAREPRAAPTRR